MGLILFIVLILIVMGCICDGVCKVNIKISMEGLRDLIANGSCKDLDGEKVVELSN